MIPSHLALASVNGGQIFGLVLAILVSFWVSGFVDRTKLFAWFSAPLYGRIDEAGSSPDQIRTIWSGLFLTIGTYFLCATVIAFSGGTIGVWILPELSENSSQISVSSVGDVPPDDAQKPAENVSAQPTNGDDRPSPTDKLFDSLTWTFPMGLVGVALARMTAVFVSTALVVYLQFLFSFTLSAAVYLVVASPGSLSPWLWLTLLDQESRLQFLSFALTLTAIVCVTTEVIIWLGARRIVVPYNLLSERIQAFSKVTQIFKPHDVIKATDNELGKIIRNEGLHELLWVTHIAPPHLTRVINELKDSEGCDDAKAIETVRKASKVIVTSEEAPNSLTSLLLPENLKRISQTTRVRYLIVNGAHLMVHLPLPFLNETGEVSNCLHIISSRAVVAMWRGKFLDFWDASSVYVHPLNPRKAEAAHSPSAGPG